MIRVLLADDQALVRAGFRALLEAAPDIEMVGAAGDGEAAVRLRRQRHPANGDAAPGPELSDRRDARKPSDGQARGTRPRATGRFRVRVRPRPARRAQVS